MLRFRKVTDANARERLHADDPRTRSQAAGCDKTGARCCRRGAVRRASNSLYIAVCHVEQKQRKRLIFPYHSRLFHRAESTRMQAPQPYVCLSLGERDLIKERDCLATITVMRRCHIDPYICRIYCYSTERK
jgi:hypothetical protein